MGNDLLAIGHPPPSAPEQPIPLQAKVTVATVVAVGGQPVTVKVRTVPLSQPHTLP